MRYPIYGKDRLSGADTVFMVLHRGIRVVVYRQGSRWLSPSPFMERPIKHRRDAVVAIRRAIDRHAERYGL